jgi:hypothetical protein
MAVTVVRPAMPLQSINELSAIRAGQVCHQFPLIGEPAIVTITGSAEMPNLAQLIACDLNRLGLGYDPLAVITTVLLKLLVEHRCLR